MIGSLLNWGLQRTRSAIRRPWVSLVFFSIIFVDACALPRGSIVGGVMQSPIGRCRCGRTPSWEVVQQGGKLWLADGYTDERQYDDNDVIAGATCNPRRNNSGVWAITRHTWHPTVQITPSRQLSFEETREIQNLVADFIEREQWSSLPEYATLMRWGVNRVNRINWSGYIHNLLTSIVAMALLASLGWILDHRDARRCANRKRRGLCPVCEYELRGHLDNGCPECGWRRVHDPAVPQPVA
jgi:hypothetical protein